MAALALALGLPALARAAGAPEGVDALLDRPFEALLATEIRSAGKRVEEIRNIPARVTILTREEIARYGWQTVEQVLRNVPGLYLLDNTEERFIGTRGTHGLFARLGKEAADGFLLLNAGVRGDDGLAGAYADMLSPGRLAALDPATRRDMDGDLDQREGSLELTGRWRSLSADPARLSPPSHPRRA